MEKNEALRTSYLLRKAYKCFIGHIDNGILVKNPFMPSNDEIKAFSDYILKNDDRDLYDTTFSLMDRQLISNAYWRLFEELNTKGLKEKILDDCKGDMKRYYANDVVYAFHSLAAIHREMVILCDIFDTSTTDYQNNNSDTQPECPGLPQVLNTKEAKALLENAIKKGLCDNNYKWLKTKSLLAYFADMASEYLNLGKGEYDGKKKNSWKPFETLFSIKGLSGAKRDYQRTGTLPDGYIVVKELFM